MSKFSRQSRYAKLTSYLEVASHNIARAFIVKMYELESEEDMDEIYFISNDPTGTLDYADYFWSLDTMYETLVNDYDPKDVWNHYHYITEYISEDREEYINLWSFVRLYKGYTGDLSEIAKKTREEREANTKFLESKEGK